ncbi:MAG TPA: hypothetical protein VFI42_14265 [Thermomicrobiaceae bacterium]|nr:hypothetical protein [Thermomicrobiaceae bacterium]
MTTSNQPYQQEQPTRGDRTVVAVFDNHAGIERAIEDLRAAGYTNQDITLVARNSVAGEEIPNIAASEQAVKQSGVGAAIGGVSGAALAFLGAGTALAIPGIGPVLLALGGLAVGAGAGAWIGSILGLDVPDDVARRYSDLAHQGRLLVFVRPFKGQYEQVEQVLHRAGSNDVQSYQYTFNVSNVDQQPGASPTTQAEPETGAGETP